MHITTAFSKCRVCGRTLGDPDMISLTEIERDLRAFADPWSPVAIDKTSAVWERDGREMSIEFAASADPSSFPDVLFAGNRMPYRAFLASSSMANLATFAEFVAKTHIRRDAYVDTWAVLEEDNLPSARKPAIELIKERSTEDLPFLSTRVVLVRGEAGSGKTVSLREATARQAGLFRQGKARSLFFLVDAQGRALSRLEDAMAKDLQDLRAGFSYAAVAPLTRHNLLVPIIDGFDELLGSGGYDEAFSSLAAFLATLEGQGSVVASARSAFFNYRDFYANASRFSGDGRLNYEVETIQVEPWDETQIRTYVAGFGEKTGTDVPQLVGAFDELHQKLDKANRQLLSKPFYAARVAELLAGGANIRADVDVLDQLVDSFIDREFGKLLDRDGKPLLSEKGHRAFLTALAEEMWWQENRRLDVGTVQAAAELVTEAFGLPPAAAQAIVERVSSYAFLTTDNSSRRALRFEHEVFYGYFLAQKLRDYIEREPADLRRFLARSVVEPTLVEQTVRLIGSDTERISRAVEAVSSVLKPSLSEVIARENAGVLIAALLRSAGSARKGLVIRNVVLQRVPLGPLTAEDIVFDSCDLTEVDLTGVKLTRPRFLNSALRNLTIDVGTTRLNDVDPSVRDSIHGITVLSDRPAIPSGKMFAPDEIARVLLAVGMKRPVEALGDASRRRSKRVQERLDVLERFLKKMERRFYASNEDIDRFPFTNLTEWREVRKLLEKHQLLEEHRLPKSGRPIPLIRLSVPPDILRRGEDPRDITTPGPVRAFWHDLLGA